MSLKNFIVELKNIGVSFTENEIMKNHTTFKVGGVADVFVTPKSTEELTAALWAAKKQNVPVFLLGNGSNILVSDKGIEGAVFDMSALGGIKVNGEEITCGAGESLRKLCITARDNSLTGLEFAYGIPGTVGGAFYMNAGAYGGEIKDVAISATCLDNNLDICTLGGSEMELAYRTSAFKTKGYIILSVKIKLTKGEKEKISEQMEAIFKKRLNKQPLDYPSAGSTFKRPEGFFAGTLIEEAGLKGVCVGGAQVSEKHAGFVINRGNATANDILALIKKVKQTVKAKSGVGLEEEVIFIGRR